MQPESPLDADPAADVHANRRSQRRDMLVVLLAALLLLGVGTAGWALGQRSHGAPPTSSSADAGFARDMSVHHGQAVLTASIVREQTGDPEIRYLAYDILTGQQSQVGMMQGWLADWGLPVNDRSRPAMAWMSSAGGHGGMPGMNGGSAMPSDMTQLLPDGRMPGMATAADVDRLRTLRGRDAEIAWLQMMISHHAGGVAMAEAGQSLAQRPAVRQLARSIAEGQASEIRYMKELLAKRGVPA